MGFIPGQMLVFDRTGARIGALSKWAISVPRSYKISDTDDMEFIVPQRDEDGAEVLTPAVWDLLAADNLIWIENEVYGMPGWGGEISDRRASGGVARCKVLGGLALLDNLTTPMISQSGGASDQIALGLVDAANAKKGVHGDLTIGFVADGTTPNYGQFQYEGDIGQGLRRVAQDTLAEFFVQGSISDDGSRIAFDVHWHDRFFIDHRSTRTFTDGPDGNVEAGGEALFSGLEVINRARLRGASTNLGQYVDYAAVRNVIRDITPEVDVVLDATVGPNFRRREDLTLSVNFGYSEDDQKALAQQVQQRYVDYYKTFLYAYHDRMGAPFLDGYDWAGPDSTNEVRLTERYYKTIQALGLIGSAAVITADSDDPTAGAGTAQIDGWVLDQNITPVGHAVGVTIDQGDPAQHYIADSSTGQVLLLESDNTTSSLWGVVAGAGETLRSVATDPADADTIYVLITGSFGARVRAYDLDSHVAVSSYDIAGDGNANDLQIDYASGSLYLVANDGVGNVQVRDLASGLLRSPDTSFASGFANPVGLSASGGLAYVIDATGHVRMLYLSTGNLAGTFNAGVAADGMYVDLANRRIWVTLSDGSIAIYHAYVAAGTVDAPGGTVGAPGFDMIRKGQYVHVVETSAHTYASASGGSGSTSYTVRSGDTLWAIAQRHYGTGASWPTIYNANRAHIIAVAQSHGFTSNFSHWIFPGEVLSIPNSASPKPPVPPLTKFLMTYTKGGWYTDIVPGPIGSPDSMQKQWLPSGDQVTGFTDSSKCALVDPAVVIYGEEGRVSDWAPERDGYGHFRPSQKWRTATGHQIDTGSGWYLQDWDIPDVEWSIPQQPWPEGLAYLQDYLRKRNSEVTVQTFKVLNGDGFWADIERGGVYHFHSMQGPVPDGLNLDVRILAFWPNEMAGTCEVAAEVYLG